MQQLISKPYSDMFILDQNFRAMKSKDKKIDNLSSQEINSDKVQGGTKKQWSVVPNARIHQDESSTNSSSKSGADDPNRPDVIMKSVIKTEKGVFKK